MAVNSDVARACEYPEVFSDDWHEEMPCPEIDGRWIAVARKLMKAYDCREIFHVVVRNISPDSMCRFTWTI